METEATKSVFDMAERLISLRREYEQADKRAKDLKNELDRHQSNMNEHMLAQETPNFTYKDKRFSARVNIWYRVHDREMFERWRAEQHKPFNIFYMISASKLRGFCNETVKSGAPFPQGVEEYKKLSVSMTAVKGRERT